MNRNEGASAPNTLMSASHEKLRSSVNVALTRRSAIANATRLRLAWRSAVGAVLLVLATAACTSASPHRAPSSWESSFVPGHDASYVGSPCPNPNYQPPGPIPTPNPYAQLNLPAGTVCGSLSVPENRSRPNGRKIKIGVAEVKAASPHPPPDPIVYLTGGPGASAVVTANQYIKAGINRDRNVIFVDQRSEYHSDPALTCPEIDNFVLEQTGLSVLATSTQTKDLSAVTTCRDRLTQQGYDLSAYNTPENAADIADLRAAMGIKQWNVYGVSYGSDLALQMLRLFPQGIRSVVLDSVVPPQVNLTDQFWSAAAEGFKALLVGCSSEPTCNQAYPSLAQDLTAAVNRLAGHPLTADVPQPAGPAQPVVIDGYSLANLVVLASLSGNYTDLPEAIHDAAIGDVMPAAKVLLEEVAGTPPGLSAWGLTFGVFCSEGVAYTSPAKELAIARRALPSFPDSVLSLVPQLPRLFSECQVWNVKRATPSTLVPTHSDVPALLLAGSLDAVTPPSNAYQAAKTLTHSTVVKLTGLGHDTLAHSACSASILNAFLAHPTERADTACAKSLTLPTLAASG